MRLFVDGITGFSRIAHDIITFQMSNLMPYDQFLDDFRDTIVSATARLRDIPETQPSPKVLRTTGPH